MYDDLFKSLFEIVTFINRPKQDKTLLNKAGVHLDTALLPIIVRVGVQKKLGIVELADQLGRDHSTVSRQVGKLQAVGLVISDNAKFDRRVREVKLSTEGRTILSKIVKARRALMREALSGWSDESLKELQRSLKKLSLSLGA